MAGENTLGIDIVARLDNFRAEMAKLGPEAGTAGKAIAAQLSKEIRAAEAAAKKAGAAAAAAGKQVDQLGAASSKAAKALGPLGGILSRLSPEMGAVSSSVAAGTTALEGFGLAGSAGVAALGAVGVAVAAGYVAWRIYSEDSARAAETAAMVATAHDALTPILEGTKTATLLLANATGALSDEELKVEQNALRVQDAVTKATAGAVASMKMLHAQMGGLGATIGDFAEEWLPSWTPLAMVVDGLTDSSSELQGQLDTLNGTVADAVEAGTANRVVTESLIKAKGDLAKASKEAADAEKELTRIHDEESKRIHTVRDALASLAEASDDSVEGRLTGARAIRAALGDEVEGLEAIRDAGLAEARTDEERAAIYAEFMNAKVNATAAAEDEIAEIVADAAEKRDDVLAKQAEDYQSWLDDQAAATKAAWSEVTQDTGALMGDLSGYLAEQAEDMAKTNKKAAKAMFVASQIAALSQAAINTGLAITQALTLPPPADIAKVALATTTGAIQIAAIAAEHPSFHAGGTRYPDEQTATVLPGESVLNRQATAAVGAGGVAAMNQGGAGVGASTSLRIGRLEAREIARTDITAGGAIPQAINKAIAKGTRKAGISGRSPIA